LLTKNCFVSAANEEIVVTEALREVSAIGKEMIDGNRAVTAVASSIVMDSLSTSGVVVLCIFSLGWVSWRGVYFLFLHVQQLPSACFPRRVT